jgi:hypothetical protein
MSLISALRTYVAGYSSLTTGAPLWVDYLGKEPDQYAIIPLPGARKIEEYIDGGSLREFPFALQAVFSTVAQAERVGSSEFFEAFAEWLDSQTKAGSLPSLGTGKTAIEIEATSWGFLLEQGDSGTGIYQISCRLEYEQEA